jgi:hypothetical protein
MRQPKGGQRKARAIAIAAANVNCRDQNIAAAAMKESERNLARRAGSP